MDSADLRELQSPVKRWYREDPAAARTPVAATGDFRDPGLTATVDGWSGAVRAGLHRATGGHGRDACSGDLLMEALVACAGVTLRTVATAMDVTLGEVSIRAYGNFDARGTLGVDRDVPVGVQDVGVIFEVDAMLDERTCERLARATERSCVVGQSLREPVRFTIHSRGT